MQQPALRTELLALEKEDQQVRAAVLKELAAKGVCLRNEKSLTDPALAKALLEAQQKLAAVDLKHQKRLKEILDRHGWPGKTLVGADAARAAWLIAQHADNDLALQKRCLRLMQAAPKGEVEPANLAYLTDRVLVGEKKKQRYGTQLRGEGGKFKPQPIEDEANVDRRRAQVGLPPLAEYLKLAQQEYEKAEGAPRKPARPGPR